MNLCDRLQIRTPLGYGSRYFFSYKGQVSNDKSTVILLVAERYARRFGAINNSQANEIYQRLAGKYCVFPGSLHCLRTLIHEDEKDAFGRPIIAHPISQKKKLFNLKAARQQVNCETEMSPSTYTLFNSGFGACHLCGAHVFYKIVFNYKTRDCHKNQNGIAICRRPMCKAIMEKLGAKIRKKSALPMIDVLMELTKNGDRTGTIAEIATIAERDIYKTHNRRSEQKGSKGHSGACA
jgi:hypothetical protein